MTAAAWRESVYSTNRHSTSYPWESANYGKPFVEQIQTKVNELESNLAIALDKFTSALTPASELDMKSSDRHLLYDEYSVTPFNYSLFDEPNWLQDIEKEVATINSWQAEAEKLAVIAIEAFRALKEYTTDVREETKLATLADLMVNSSAIYDDLMTQHHSALSQHIPNSDESPLLQIETWSKAGFEVENTIESEAALAKIVSLPLKTYKLKDDKQQYFAVSRTTRRTRYHTGVIDENDEASEKLDPPAIFSFNIGAVAHIANSMGELSSKLSTTSAFLHHYTSIDKTIVKLKSITKDSTLFKTPALIASEVAALETEAALKRVTQLCHALMQSTKINLLRARLASRLTVLSTNDLASEKLTRIERAVVSARETNSEEANAGLDTVLVFVNAIEDIKTIWNSTMRELQELDDAARIESRVAKEEINAEAVVERENESTSLEQIKIIGNALTNEVIQAIENIFWHLTGCMHHIVSTEEGRHQFLFYVIAAASMVFVTSTLKEGISLVCLFILRFFTAPRLVREYGNLRMRPSWCAANDAEEIVLPDEIKDRMEVIVRVSSAASARGFPMRSILIHGKPGCGKSMVAKKLAESTGLPYAMMSGGDVFPLKSQGPSELKRLLMWASKGRGGIIIIDEAECALGSRAKTTQDSSAVVAGLGDETKSTSGGYSRDCLNVLLSMTGTFGNIMLILTTSNPSELDEAVLDRMDEHLHLPVPSRYERYSILNNAFSRVFCSAQTAPSRNYLSFLSKPLPTARYNESFNVESALSKMAQDSNTGGFSGRELKKLVQMILYKCHASDSGILDYSMWKKETQALCKTFAAKHLLWQSPSRSEITANL